MGVAAGFTRRAEHAQFAFRLKPMTFRAGIQVIKSDKK
jgi:hypothetical protein